MKSLKKKKSMETFTNIASLQADQFLSNAPHSSKSCQQSKCTLSFFFILEIINFIS